MDTKKILQDIDMLRYFAEHILLYYGTFKLSYSSDYPLPMAIFSFHSLPDKKMSFLGYVDLREEEYAPFALKTLSELERGECDSLEELRLSYLFQEKLLSEIRKKKDSGKFVFSHLLKIYFAEGEPYEVNFENFLNDGIADKLYDSRKARWENVFHFAIDEMLKHDGLMLIRQDFEWREYLAKIFFSTFSSAYYIKSAPNEVNKFLSHLEKRGFKNKKPSS